MSPLEMIVLIVAIVAVAGIIKSRHAMHVHRTGPADDAESRRLRDEVQTLRERVQVLERIATSSESTLEQEIEKLRDR